MSEPRQKIEDVSLDDYPEIRELLDQWDADNKRRFLLVTALASAMDPSDGFNAKEIVLESERLLLAVKEREAIALSELEKKAKEIFHNQTKNKNE